MTFQTFYFRDASYYNSDWWAKNYYSYEHETQIYDFNFADYDGYWNSNLPYAYKDTQAGDGKNIPGGASSTAENFAVGTNMPRDLKSYTRYYYYMSIRAGSSKSATVIIKGQLGWKAYPNCFSYGAWCTVTQIAFTPALIRYTAPDNTSRRWWY